MKSLWAAVIAVIVASCGEQVTTMSRQQTEVESEMQFLEFSDSAFDQTEKIASFWAVQGQNRALVLRYADTGRKYLRFEVDSASLATWPDGTPVMPGDSVQITVEADAFGRWLFHFSPSGLTFSASAPAKLTLEYERSVIADLAEPRIWKRDMPFVPWQSLPTTRLPDRVVRANIYDFTDFGLAIN